MMMLVSFLIRFFIGFRWFTGFFSHFLDCIADFKGEDITGPNDHPRHQAGQKGGHYIVNFGGDVVDECTLRVPLNGL